MLLLRRERRGRAEGEGDMGEARRMLLIESRDSDTLYELPV